VSNLCRTLRRNWLLMVTIALPTLLISSPAGAQDDRIVTLELVLAIDTSVSIDPQEYFLQITGLAQAFRDPGVLAAIAEQGPSGIAVTLVQWAAGMQQATTIDWMHLHDALSSERFAQAIEASPRRFTGNATAIAGALAYATRTFDNNGFRGMRRVIDLSGDGRNNSGPRPSVARDLTVAFGITINGLAILDRDLGLSRYFEENVVGGPGSFVVTAISFADYAPAIRAKLLREISVPIAERPLHAAPRSLAKGDKRQIFEGMG
jgi:Protein of unknown function (DUF1194)